MTASVLRHFLTLHWRAQTAETRWRRCVDELRTHQGVLERFRRRADRLRSQTYLRARARTLALAGPGGEVEQARAAVDAAYGGRAPLAVVKRLEAYVLERFPEMVGDACPA